MQPLILFSNQIWISLHRKLADISTTMVLIFRSSSGSWCFAFVHTAWYSSRRPRQASPGFITLVHCCLLNSAAQGTAIRHLYFPVIECCSGDSLSSDVSHTNKFILFNYNQYFLISHMSYRCPVYCSP